MKKNLKHVLEYHQNTKHHFQRLAVSPGFLDWANQPDPFRRYRGARLLELEKIPPSEQPLYDDAFKSDQIPAVDLNLRSISLFF